MKRAIVYIASEALAECVGVLRDHDLVVRTSISPPLHKDYGVALVIEDSLGNRLPSECESGWWEVSIQMMQETLGKQRIVRISKIEAVRKLDFGPALAA